MGTQTFASAGSRTGDGNISISASVGYYLWLLESVTTGSVKTNVLVYQNITDATSTGNSVMYRILTAVQTQIQALALTGVSSSNIVVKWLGRQWETTTDPVPSVIISPAPSAETMPNDLTGTDKIGYPVLVTMIDKQNQDFTGNLNRNLKWRELINREFRYQPLAGVAEVIYCEPEPKPQFEAGMFMRNTYVSSFVMRFISRETRGN